MNIEVGEVGDLVYDPFGGDLGVILEKSYGAFWIWWPQGGLLEQETTTREKHTDFVYHPEFNEDFVGYCLADDKEKYYESW
mgnify:FL=1|jgi:hypothetical protein